MHLVILNISSVETLQPDGFIYIFFLTLKNKLIPVSELLQKIEKVTLFISLYEVNIMIAQADISWN